MLGHCLTLGTSDAWSAFATLVSARLAARERASLAFASLASLDFDQAQLTASAALGAAGSPLPPFLGGMDDARFWASVATRAELKAHALAAFEAMSSQDRTAFLHHISEGEIAA